MQKTKTLLIALVASMSLFACGSGGGTKTISSTADYKSAGMDLMDKMKDVFKETDCDKLATNVKSFGDANKGTIENIKTWEKAHPDDKKAMEKDSEDKMKDMMGAMMGTMLKCKDNKALQDAMSNLKMD